MLLLMDQLLDEPTLSLVNAILSAKCAASLSFESFNIFSIVLDNVSMWLSFLCSFSVAYIVMQNKY